MSTVVLVTARTRSSRLPNKCLLPFGSTNVIRHVMKRADRIGSEAVLCTTEDPSDDLLVTQVQSLGYHVFRGDSENKIARWADAAEHFGASTVHALDADDPFFDPSEVRDSLLLLEREALGMLRTSVRSDGGMASVGTSFSQLFLRELAERTRKLSHNNLDVIPWESLFEETDAVDVMPSRDLGVLVHDVRLTLDYQEDYEMLRVIANAFEATVSRIEVERFLARNPELTAVNTHLTPLFLANQAKQRASFANQETR